MKMKRQVALLVISALLIGLLPMGNATVSKAANTSASTAGYGLNNPTTDSNGVTTWDCVWFGNYWQEDTNGDGKADKNDAKQPIKWRVMSVNGDDAFLLADKNLDVQRYNDTYTSVTWETCTMRSWLNGYGAASNKEGKDYAGSNFLDYAFSFAEQSAIRTTNVVNDDNSFYGTEGGNDTSDKVYLLSIDEAMNPAYGFTSTVDSTKTRQAVNTSYVAAGGEIKSSGMISAGSADVWWLRSPGYDSDIASFVYDGGYVYRNGGYVSLYDRAARPALHLNLSSTSSWSYAGTVTSEGGEIGTATPEPVPVSPSPDDNNFESVDKSGLSFSVSDYDSMFETLDAAPVEGAKVKVEGIGEISTDVEGKAQMPNPLSEPSAMKKIEVTKDGYRDYIYYTTVLSPELVNVFETNHFSASLRRKKEGDDSNPYLSTFVYYNRERAESTYGRTFEANETVTFRACGVWNEKEPGYYCLYQDGGKSFESTDGVFRLHMKDSFYEKGDIHIKMVAADGTEVVEDTEIRLASIGFGNGGSSDDSGIPLLNAVGESEQLVKIPFLENDKLSLDLGKFKTVVKRDGKKIRIMLGANKDLTPDQLKDETWEKWKKFCESQPTDLSLSQWKEVVDGAMECSWTGAVKMKITGYGWLEGEVGQKVLNGGLQVILDGGVGFKQQYMVGVIPVYGEQSFGIKGKLQGSASYNFSEKKLDGDNEVTVEPYLNIGGGIGVLYAATVGAEGSATMPTKFSWPKGLISSKIEGSLTLKANVLGFEYEKVMAKATYPLYPGTEKSIRNDMIYQKMNKYLAASEESSVYSMEDYSLPEERVDEGIWLGEEQTKSARSVDAGGNEKLLMTGISDLAEPKLIQNGDTTLVLFLSEDSERSTIQRTRLVYSRYDKTTGTWEEPQAVWEDGTADYLPSVCTANGQIVVSWLNFSQDITDESTMEEALSASELRSAVWNDAEGTFDVSDKSMDSSDKGTYNSTKAVADTEGNLTMVGLKNTDSDIFGLSGNNVLFMNGTFEDKAIRKEITLTQGIPVSYDVSVAGETITAAVCMDTDKDISTLDDREIYLYTADGEVTKLTANSINDSAPQYAVWNGKNVLFWYAEDGYRMMNEDGVVTSVYDSENAMHSEAFTVASGDNGECAIAWAETDEENVHQLMTAIYDDTEKQWTRKVVLTSGETDISKPSGYFTSDGDMEFMYRSKNGSDGADSLYVWQRETAPELEIVDAYIMDGTEIPDSMTKVYVGVKNNGTKSVKDYSIRVGDQTTAGTASLLPGESAVLEADYTVPSPIVHGDLTISVDVADDTDISNNTFTLTTGYADLTVCVTEEENENGKRVQVNVGNTEAMDAEAGLEVRKGSEEGEIVSQYALGTLKQGDIVTLDFYYKKSSDGYEEGADKLYYVVTTETEEKYKSNNYDFCILSDDSGELSESPSPTPTLIPTTSPSTTPVPTEEPGATPTVEPSVEPVTTPKPSGKPAVPPTEETTTKPTASLETEKPGATPTAKPSAKPTTKPGAQTPFVPVYPTQTFTPVLQPTASPTATSVGRVTSIKLTQKKRTVTALWKKVPGADGYQIWYSTSKKWKGKKQKLLRKNKVTVKNLKKKKTYYFHVRAYRLDDEEKVYGAWSKTKKIKMKK